LLPGFTKFCRFNNVDDSNIDKVIQQHYDNQATKFLGLIYKKKSEYLFQEGDKSDYFYGVIKGLISIRKWERVTIVDEEKSLDYHRIEEVVKLYINEGECFGEWGLIYNDLRQASAYLEEDTYLFVLDKEGFENSFKVLNIS